MQLTDFELHHVNLPDLPSEFLRVTLDSMKAAEVAESEEQELYQLATLWYFPTWAYTYSWNVAFTALFSNYISPMVSRQEEERRTFLDLTSEEKLELLGIYNYDCYLSLQSFMQGDIMAGVIRFPTVMYHQYEFPDDGVPGIRVPFYSEDKEGFYKAMEEVISVLQSINI